MQEIVWRTFRFELPETWEMLQFSRNPDAGKCRFADRFDQRLEWNWKASGSEPDLIETINRFVNENKGARKAMCGDWVGVELDEPRTSRYLRYFEDESCTLEMIFSWPARRDEALLRQVLQTVQRELPAAGLQRWRAFGMELYVGGDAALAECQVSPAFARMKFDSTKKNSAQEFQRLGMVPEWLGASVTEWLKSKVPNRMKAAGATAIESQGHQGGEIEAEGYLEKFSKVLRRATRFQAAAWLCPQDGRLYYHGRTTSNRDRTQPAGRLSCCPAFSHE